ncbi:MAG: ATP-binding protein [Planctomycetaceae bacterium]|jgi:hypothetical protein|nr:ATP-binding protein [Planctomycetaceae bacterium]
MTTPKIKRLPLGNSDFRSIRTENYFYVDKTWYIELFEQEHNKNQIFIRPRRFGKSLFLSTLSYYYDINYVNEFERLFGDLYIGQNPTPEKNSYAVLKFDFSGLNTLGGADVFTSSFHQKIRSTIRKFLDDHKNIFPDTIDIIRQINREQPNLSIVDWAFDIAQSAGIKIFVIIDEYDHFATDLIKLGVVGGDDFYTTMVKSNGLVRSFYALLKSATTTSIVNRTFITGISPVMLDDLTSGYNIAANYSLDERYNEMLGFTREEVNVLMEGTGVEADKINIDMEYYYNGYLFNKWCKNKVYNSSMILYIFNQILRTGKPPEYLIDPNLGMDISRLQHLIQKESNRKILVKILTEGCIVSNILVNFLTEQLDKDASYFVSLLFYMGFLTIKDSYLDELRLVIPNFSILTVYWGYMRQLVNETSPDTTVEEAMLKEAINTLAMEGDIYNFIDYVSKNVFSKLSDYDLQHFNEKYIKVMLLSYLFLKNVYIPISEYEVDSGRIDIFLQRNPLFPEVRYEWVLELKYCKTSAKESEITAKRQEGLEQLNDYIQSHHLKDRPNLKPALLLFIGKNKYEIVTEGIGTENHVNKPNAL